jgi:hypothetical protein
MNGTEFYERIMELPESNDTRDLEEFLLALYSVVVEKKGKDLTYDLVFQMIKDALIAPALEFPDDWLFCDTAPDENRISIAPTNSEAKPSALTPFEYTLEVIKFQISELHKMRGKQLDDKFRYDGVTSETGNYWYNFDPFGNLECGARCMGDRNKEFDYLDWSFIGELLENGRIYE